MLFQYISLLLLLVLYYFRSPFAVPISLSNLPKNQIILIFAFKIECAGNVRISKIYFDLPKKFLFYLLDSLFVVVTGTMIQKQSKDFQLDGLIRCWFLVKKKINFLYLPNRMQPNKLSKNWKKTKGKIKMAKNIKLSLQSKQQKYQKLCCYFYLFTSKKRVEKRCFVVFFWITNRNEFKLFYNFVATLKNIYWSFLKIILLHPKWIFT